MGVCVLLFHFSVSSNWNYIAYNHMGMKLAASLNSVQLLVRLLVMALH
jgi:hypothetical protein